MSISMVTPRTSKEEGGGESNGHPIGFSDLKFEAFIQSKRNFQYLYSDNKRIF